MNYATLRVRRQATICHVQLWRPEANNTISELMIEELNHVLAEAGHSDTTVVVLEGLPEVFCFGADFAAIGAAVRQGDSAPADPAPLFAVFEQLALGDFMTVAKVCGKVNAGGVGFVAACDIVLADDSAVFSLSELLFDLVPAVVLPFLARRVGFQRAHYLTASTQTIDVRQAAAWGLVDVHQTDGEALLRRHLLRLGRLSKAGIMRYKAYLREFAPLAAHLRESALATNLAMFSDPATVAGIRRFAEHGLFPWEAQDERAIP